MPILIDNSKFFVGKMESAIADVSRDIQSMIVDRVHDKMLYGYHEPHGEDGHTAIYDTGALYESIKAELKEYHVHFLGNNTITIVVSANTEYASSVHNGTATLNGRPFLTDALTEATPEILEMIRDKLSNA